jgi:16S rRNA (adenine1518-N6/adenine1519-N6)-dimethyltransferase
MRRLEARRAQALRPALPGRRRHHRRHRRRHRSRSPGQALVEIGPGLGALTEALLARGAALTVIELDRDLAARWRRDGRVTVVEADVLKVDFGAWPTPASAAAHGRQPALQHLHADPVPPAAAGRARGDQHFMLQKEVVERMVAAPGTRTTAACR